MTTTPTSKMDPSTPKSTEPKATPSAVDFEPPLACVRRILKHSLPQSTNVGKDASAAFCRACGIFIIYITACANDFAREHKRQTITANDVLQAIKELDFDEFTSEMKHFLDSYRTTEKKKKDAKAKAAAEKAKGKKSETQEEEEEDEDDGDNHKRSLEEDFDEEEDEDSPKAKRARIEEHEANEEVDEPNQDTTLEEQDDE